MRIRLRFFDSLMDLFGVDPLCIIGLAVIVGLVLWFTRKESIGHKLKALLFSSLLFYYALISLTNIFGVATLRELVRMHQLGASFLNLKLELMPLADGITFGFIFNIFAFMPIGFLIPLISSSWRKASKTVLLGAVFSLTIEISQLFTMHRVTDINDLLTNTLGTFLGYLCFTAIARLFFRKKEAAVSAKYLPAAVLAVGFLTVFFFS